MGEVILSRLHADRKAGGASKEGLAPTAFAGAAYPRGRRGPKEEQVPAAIAFLLLGYVLSQFFRVFLAVLTPVLTADLGLTSEQFALASGLWFAAFALMQVPVGMALDRIGPRVTTAVLLAVGGAGGALVFACATSAWQIYLAMVLLGAGCAPVLMSGYYVIAHAYRPALFGVLASVLIGVGSLGNILGAAPMAALAGAIGWRQTMACLAGVTLIAAAGLGLFLRNPDRGHGTGGAQKGSLLDVLRMPGFWLILPMAFANNAASADIRGLWAAPWATDLYGADTLAIGHVTLAMSLAMVAGSFLYGPADRLLGSYKRAVLWGNLALAAVLAALAFVPGLTLLQGAVLLMLVGFFGSSYPVVMAHARLFFPAHLVGRGMTVMNLLAMGGIAVAQFGTGPVFRAATVQGPSNAYAMVFLSFLLPLAVALMFYAFARDKPDPID